MSVVTGFSPGVGNFGAQSPGRECFNFQIEDMLTDGNGRSASDGRAQVCRSVALSRYRTHFELTGTGSWRKGNKDGR